MHIGLRWEYPVYVTLNRALCTHSRELDFHRSPMYTLKRAQCTRRFSKDSQVILKRAQHTHQKEPNKHTQNSRGTWSRYSQNALTLNRSLKTKKSPLCTLQRSLYTHSKEPCTHTHNSPVHTQKSPVYKRKSSRTLERALGTHSKRPYIHNQRRPIYILKKAAEYDLCTLRMPNMKLKRALYVKIQRIPVCILKKALYTHS